MSWDYPGQLLSFGGKWEVAGSLGMFVLSHGRSAKSWSHPDDVVGKQKHLHERIGFYKTHSQASTTICIKVDAFFLLCA